MGAAAHRRNAQGGSIRRARVQHPPNIPRTVHVQEIQELTQKYERKILELQKQLDEVFGGKKPKKPLADSTKSEKATKSPTKQ